MYDVIIFLFNGIKTCFGLLFSLSVGSTSLGAIIVYLMVISILLRILFTLLDFPSIASRKVK